MTEASNVVSLEPKDTQALTRSQEARRKLDAYCAGLYQGLSREKAYIAAGFSELWARDNSKQYHRNNAEYIQAYMSEKIGNNVPAAIKVIAQIMNNENEKGGIRLKAAQDLLDRAGYSPKQKIELTTKEVTELSTEELKAEIQKMFTEDPSLKKVFQP